MYIQFSQRLNSRGTNLRVDIMLICMLIATLIWINVSVVTVTQVNEARIMNRVGMGFSFLIHPNPYFVYSMMVEKSSADQIGAMLYGFNKKPPLDVLTTWTDTHYVSPRAHINEDWIYVLNKGSIINISYNVPGSASLLLTITRGNYVSGQWYYDQSIRDRSMPWNIIHGNGVIRQNIQQTGRYQINVRSLRSQPVEVQLNVTARTFAYNTTEAQYRCMLAKGQCRIPVLFGEENYVVVTTPLKQGVSDDEWHLKVAYGGRIGVFVGGIVLCNLIVFVVIYSFNVLVELCKSTDRWAFLRSQLPCVANYKLSSCCSEESKSLLDHGNLIETNEGFNMCD